jgi:hypothetical protein
LRSELAFQARVPFIEDFEPRFALPLVVSELLPRSTSLNLITREREGPLEGARFETKFSTPKFVANSTFITTYVTILQLAQKNVLKAESGG